MQVDYSDGAPIERVPSTIWPKVPSPFSRRSISINITDLCSYIENTPDAEHAPIKKLIVRQGGGMCIWHEFLIISLTQPNGDDCWLRLERVPKSLFIASEPLDTVSAVLQDSSQPILIRLS